MVVVEEEGTVTVEAPMEDMGIREVDTEVVAEEGTTTMEVALATVVQVITAVAVGEVMVVEVVGTLAITISSNRAMVP